MRKQMWFVVGFAAGCIPGACLLWNRWFALTGVLCLAIAVGLCFLKAKPAKITAAILLGLSFATVWIWGFDTFYLRAARQHDGQTITATVEITDYSYETNYGMAANGTIELNGKSFRVLTYLDEMDPLSPGDSVQGSFQLHLTTYADQGKRTHHQGEGIFLVAYSQDEARVQYNHHIPIKCYPAKLRQDIIEMLDSVFPSDTAGFAKALLLGDSSDLSYQEDTSFKISGIRHVIAVSGLHVSILFSLVYLFFGRRRLVNALVGLPLLFLFAAIAGFTPSVVRACLMQGLILIGALLDKEYDPPTSLAFSVLVMLLVNPMTITSVSFQLSVGCLVGIFLFHQRIFDYLQSLFRCPKGMSVRSRLTRWLAGSVAITVSAMAVTAPFSAYYFGTVSIIGILANLVTLWIISFVFYGIMLACVLGAIWLSIGKVIGFLVSFGIRYVQYVAKLLASLPMASVYTCSIYIVIWLVFCYCLLVLFLFAKKKKPGLLVVGVAVSLAVALSASYIEPRLDPMRVTVMDVGQGQSILLESHGKRFLVDCGGDYPQSVAETVGQRLLSQGITRLDGIILTHYDADHAEAVPYLLTRVRADVLYLPDIADDGTVKETLQKEYPEKIQWIRTDTVLSGKWGNLTIIASGKAAGENESGLCILFQTENCDILITGDRGTSGEQELIERIALPELELLIVGHHGAGNSTSLDLLRATKPVNAVISVGKDNRYGHPTQDVLRRLEMFSCCIIRTDLNGTIIYKGEHVWQSRIRRLMDFVT